LRWEADQGGQSRISEDDYIEGAPELIVEVAASTASYDVHDKLRAYRRNGAREYMVWLTEEQALRWYRLEEGEYRQQEPDAEGRIKSGVFLGLWLAVEALLAGKMAVVLQELQQGIEGRS
jgi:Uma2 family endonuclease